MHEIPNRTVETAEEGRSMRADDAMNAEEVARYLHIGKNSVYQLARTGQLTSYRIGRKLRFSLVDADAYLASTRVATDGGAPATDAGASAPDGLPPEFPRRFEDAALVEAARLGEPERDPFVIAGTEAAADLLARRLNEAGVPTARSVKNSYAGLVSAYAGQADAAVVHLFDQKTNSYNVEYVRRLMPGVSSLVMRLYSRRQGYVVRAGNPKKLATWGALLREDVRLANRGRGSASRVLLDEKLRALDARTAMVNGYDDEFPAAVAAAERVAVGAADVALGIAATAYAVEGVDFVALQVETIDVAVVKTERTRPLVRLMKRLAADPRFKEELGRIEECDAKALGAIVYEC